MSTAEHSRTALSLAVVQVVVALSNRRGTAKAMYGELTFACPVCGGGARWTPLIGAELGGTWHCFGCDRMSTGDRLRALLNGGDDGC
jgi:hypothetical protein